MKSFDNKSHMKSLWAEFVRRCHGLLIWVFLLSMLTNLLMLTGPFFILQTYNLVLSSRSQETLVALFFLVIILYGFYSLLEFLRSSMMSKVAARFQQTMGPRVFNVFLQRVSLRKELNSGHTALRDVDAICQFFSSPVILALFDIPWTLVFLAVIFFFHLMLGWLAVAGAFVLISIALLNQHFTYRISDDTRYQAHCANLLAQQASASSDYIRAQGLATTMTQRWTHLRNTAMNQQTNTNDKRAGFSSFSKAFRLLLQSAMLALGAALVIEEQLTLGAMIAASILLGRVLAPIEQVIGSWMTAQQALLAYNTLRRFLNEVAPTPQATQLLDLQAHEGQPILKVQDLSVIAGTERIILHNITFSLLPGEVLGIVGNNGVGKTTLVKAVMNVIIPASGEIRLGDATLEQYEEEQLGRLIGYLPQDVKFFDGSVAENIAHMQLSPNYEDVLVAAKKAKVHEVILKLPNGYDTLISLSHVPLSRGKQQQMALARALFYDPLILALDEPNAFLDYQSNITLNQTIMEMKEQKKAILIMTHKNSSVLQICDKTLIIQDGQVVQHLRKEQTSKDRITFVPDTT